MFGPVPSRRLGLSLGVDLLPYKTCSLDCVYCESGKTTELTTTRRPYVPAQEVIDELEGYLNSNPKLDYITFSGSGEPTLHSDIGKVIAFIKKNYPQYKVALLTNSTLFYREDVRKDIAKADLVVASVDSVTSKGFQKINRPGEALHLRDMIDGLKKFRQDFNNSLWVEVFIVPGVNDTDAEIEQINSVLEMIKPDKIQLNSLDRPGVEDWVRPADENCLKHIIPGLTAAEVISKVEIETGATEPAVNIRGRITALIKRRPCTREDIITSLGITEKEADMNLNKLIDADVVFQEKLERGIFYLLK